MGKNSKIAWTDHTFNTWWGCTKVSPACEHCYAERQSNRFGSWWGKDAPRRFFGQRHWNEPLAWDRQAAASGVNARVFCGSMCDIFEDRPDLVEPRQRLYDLIRATPHLTWLLLTKRPENMSHLLPPEWASFPANSGFGGLYQNRFPSNVWLGITAEDQARFEERWFYLEWVGRHWLAPVLFVSAEPLLGPLNIDPHALPQIIEQNGQTIHTRGMDWLITGGETGPDARPMYPGWIYGLRYQCSAYGIPFFFKQWGEWAEVAEFTGDNGKNLSSPLRQVVFAGNIKMQRVGKEVSGHLIGGLEYHEFPQTIMKSGTR